MRNGRPSLRAAGAGALLALAPMASRAGSAQDASAARLELLIPRLMKEGDVPGLSLAPTRTWFKDILARGSAAVAEGPVQAGKSSAALTEEQVNRVGYWLLASKRVKDAIAVFEVNVAAHPDSWNVHDSLGEAYAKDGQRERAIASYEKSLTLNPANSNGAEALQRLRAQAGN